MKKLKLQVQMSVDGFIAGPNGEMDWMTWNWDEKLGNYVNELTDSVDTILLGRKMSDGFIGHWGNVVTNPQSPEYDFGKKMMDKPKVVFSKTMLESPWENTTIASGDLVEEVNRLKSQPGSNIIVYGGASFVSSLVKAQLIDEFNLFVNPAVIGKGISIFNEIETRQNLQLIKSISYDCGIVLLQYELKKS